METRGHMTPPGRLIVRSPDAVLTSYWTALHLDAVAEEGDDRRS